MSERGWKQGKGRPLWFVAGDGQLYLSTARMSRLNAIKAWLESATFDDDPPSRETWKYWYGRGYRAVRAKIKFKVMR